MVSIWAGRELELNGLKEAYGVLMSVFVVGSLATLLGIVLGMTQTEDAAADTVVVTEEADILVPVQELARALDHVLARAQDHVLAPALLKDGATTLQDVVRIHAPLAALAGTPHVAIGPLVVVLATKAVRRTDTLSEPHLTSDGTSIFLFRGLLSTEILTRSSFPTEPRE
ncbi:uncharacterized protein LOC135120588 isoform X2 [Zophobas morio]|jgi:hypothetical protein|uniref:uncharacterized protein LOC135120588 isoform X2 n=1 Tax=Zophobas morio TaxID=2755281 RepID=UPI0030829375